MSHIHEISVRPPDRPPAGHGGRVPADREDKLNPDSLQPFARLPAQARPGSCMAVSPTSGDRHTLHQLVGLSHCG